MGIKSKILIFQGSPRDKNGCPGQWGKSRSILQYLMKKCPKDIELDICDLSVKNDGVVIKPCRGCYSTAGGYHCHFPCDCYKKNFKDNPDLMHNKNIYDRLQICDGFMVIAPIHWYCVPSQIKAMFDRLVCINLTISSDFAIKLLGEDDFKNPEFTRKLDKEKKYENMKKNHLEGKYGAFFLHGDDGADDYSRHDFPDSLKGYLNGERQFAKDIQLSVMPIVWQCRYSGIYVPDELIKCVYINKDISYSQANDNNNKQLFIEAMDILLTLNDNIQSNKKIEKTLERGKNENS